MVDNETVGRIEFGSAQLFGEPTLALLRHTAEVTFFIPGQPVAKGRARHRIVRTKSGRDFINAYTPKETEHYENRVAMAASEAMNGQAPWLTPVEMVIEICLEVPASYSEKKRRACYAELIGATKKPDMDNCEKAILDGCNAILYDDDSRVVRKTTIKRYAAIPGVTVCAKKLAMASA